MNPAFVFLVILCTVLLWFLSAFVFYPLGRFLHKLWKNANDEMNRDDKNEKGEKE